jgi:hypothetical protein
MRLIDILKEKQYKTDKWTDHHYVQEIYEPLFAQYREKEINFCEVGVWNGKNFSKIMNKGGVYIIEDISFIPESIKTMFRIDGESTGPYQVSKIQYEIPNIQFYSTGGEIFTNQPIGVVHF